MLKQILSLSDKEYKRVIPALFAYLFDKIDMEKFIDYVGDRKEGTRIKDIARQNGYILKNCKLYAYYCHCNRSQDLKLPNCAEFEVDQKDSLLLKRLNLKHLGHTKYRAFTLDEFDRTVNRMVASVEIRNNVGKFVTKKMSFLMKSYGETREDIEAYLKEMAIIAVYKQYPRYMSYLHMINVAKAQIHNKGQTFITSSTAKSRQRLIQSSGGGFEAVHVDISTLAEVAAPINYSLEIKERVTALSQIEHVLPTRTKEFLLCAAGQYHEGLSQFLQVGNDVAAETMSYLKYMNRVQDYFGTTPEKVDRLFENIRSRIFQTSL